MVYVIKGRASVARTLGQLAVAAATMFALSALRDVRADEPELATQVKSLVEQLDHGAPAERTAAEQALVRLGLAAPGTGEAFLALLPAPDDKMSQEVATRLARIRIEVQTRLAERSVQQTRVTIDVTDAPLAEVLAEFERQSGNRVVDDRSEFADNPPEKLVTLKVADEPYWSALDKLLDAANLSPYPYAVGDALGLVERQEGTLPRSGQATYAGPFRIEPLGTSARRGIRKADESGVDLQMEIAWEPRLRPVAISQSVADLSAKTDDGAEAMPAGEGDKVFDVEVPADSPGAEVTLPLKLPARAAKNFATVGGRFKALVPGRIVDLKFANLAAAKDAVQDAGGVKVTLNRVAKNQALWEIHMRIAVASLDENADTARGWVFQNVTYLQGKDGERLDHAGFETTMQDEHQTGFAYFFELPEGRDIADYTWVYRTPAAIVNLPVEYELKDIPLP
jgi:hypothetical protein